MKTNKKDKINKNIIIKNRRASFDYELLDSYTAGMVLVGTEIKSIRQGKASLVEAFCYFHNGELWLKNASITEYSYGSYNNHKATRERKLLLNRKELKRLEEYVQTPGVTIVPTKIYINERGLAKIEIAPARGKKQYDKRASMKERDDRREMDRAMKR
ncbi:MAG: SsrA-binding protein SmpB [Porphyromonadaceae bacterium]|nr:SsrA-binding protein SmpB [Porphyromonadaceae bacterium]